MHARIMRWQIFAGLMSGICVPLYEKHNFHSLGGWLNGTEHAGLFRTEDEKVIPMYHVPGKKGAEGRRGRGGGWTADPYLLRNPFLTAVFFLLLLLLLRIKFGYKKKKQKEREITYRKTRFVQTDGKRSFHMKSMSYNNENFRFAKEIFEKFFSVIRIGDKFLAGWRFLTVKNSGDFSTCPKVRMR